MPKDKRLTKNKYLKCSICGKRDKTVSIRIDPYQEDVNNTRVWEQVCDGCEHEQLMDI